MKKLTFRQDKNEVHAIQHEKTKTSEKVQITLKARPDLSEKLGVTSIVERRVYCLDGPGGNYRGL